VSTAKRCLIHNSEVNSKVKVAIFGLGYVGMTTAACLAREGHDVIGVDVSESKVDIVNSGHSPVSEPGLDALVKSARDDNRLIATLDAIPHIDTCQLAIVCVGTPSASDGSHNMGYIAEVTRQIATMVSRRRADKLTVIYRSTMRPGTIEELIIPLFQHRLCEKSGLVEIVYNPEFLRESTAVEDFFNPPKVVIGTHDGQHCTLLDEIIGSTAAPIFYTRYKEAEFTKFVDNAFHALKIVFANEIGRICTGLGISAAKVHDMFISDTKLNISSRYLKPGGAFGGSCLPKDVRALEHLASELGTHAYLVGSLLRSNEIHKRFIFEQCTKELRRNAKILMLGLSFKANSDDLRESPNMDLARRLIHEGYCLSIYDPDVDPLKLMGHNLGYAFSGLPSLAKLFVKEEEIKITKYDLVVDNRDWAVTLPLNTQAIVNPMHLTES